MRSECVPVGDKEKTFVLLLQQPPVFQHSVEMAKVQPSCWSHAGDDTSVAGDHFKFCRWSMWAGGDSWKEQFRVGGKSRQWGFKVPERSASVLT